MDNQFQQTYQDISNSKISPSSELNLNQKSYKKTSVIMGSIILASIMFVFGFVSSQIQSNGRFNLWEFLTNFKSETNSQIGDNLDSDTTTDKFNRLEEIISILKSGYVDKNISEKKMVDEAIKGLVSSLDDAPTAYFTEEDTIEYKKSMTGSFEGIGAELAYNQGRIFIKKFLQDSPAEKSGLKIGEYIFKVDDYTVQVDDNINDVVMKIRGKGGSTVKMQVSENIEGNNLRNIEITRGPIVSKSMDYEELGDGIIMIRLSRFTENTLSEFERDWDTLVNTVLSKKPSKLILDLRGNPGGYLDGAHYVASEFLPQNKVVLMVEGRNGIEDTYSVNRVGKLLDIPVIVLINESSASASEILAGALQQSGRAKLIGTKTYGKGTAQKVIEPQAWNGASLHFTVQRWLLPDKRNITKSNPITPDIEIETTIEDIKKGYDPTLEAAKSELKK